MPTSSSLVIPVFGVPAPQGSKRGFATKTGRVVLVESSQKVKPWRQDVKEAAIRAAAVSDWQQPAGPVRLDIAFFMPRPGYHYGTGKNAGRLKASAPTFCDKKPDADKALRSTLDALTQSGVYRDDAQVVMITALQRYANTRPGAHITVSQVQQVFPARGSIEQLVRQRLADLEQELEELRAALDGLGDASNGRPTRLSPLEVLAWDEPAWNPWLGDAG